MLRRFYLAVFIAIGAVQTVNAEDVLNLGAYERLDGFLDLYWDEDSGRVLLDTGPLGEPLIYQSSLARGVGSNDLGLDRGQLGATKIVRFFKSGPKVLLVEDNLAFRANSQNNDEKQAVEESFARSVIWGFEDLDSSPQRTIVDMTPFLVRDAHGIARRLSTASEGAYSVDASRSAIYLPRTNAFPDNTEAEAIVTLVGEPSGRYLPSVAPDARAVTVHVHHSFIRLPDDDYEPLAYDPRAGVIGLRWNEGGFSDYATAIGDDLTTDYGRRHRLKKKDPRATVSEAVEPIIYYLDRGAPEPVRTALLDGARWWNQAFEAAGYKDAFQVRLLPEDADPMDVRYNVIQWVHRSKRGWSYGDSVTDPRTGEILKGHVSLGSLRVRQDYLIAEGLLAPYGDETVPTDMIEMSLARIRQLSAHEVGHTIGFEHNFAASTQDRSSVMDYPVPLIKIRDDGSLDLSEAYDDKIGSWDKRTVIYAYQDFASDLDANAERDKIMAETLSAGFRYVADEDARSPATAHPDGNLWENGSDAVEELRHLMKVREIALNNFSEKNIRLGRPLATIEEVLVPIYLLHRFQIEAVAKLVGGFYYNYNLRGDNQALPQAVTAGRQQQAIDALLGTLDPEALQVPDKILALIAPRPPGNQKSRETFTGASGVMFDAKAPAASAVAMTLNVLLEPSRAARMAQNDAPGFTVVTRGLISASWRSKPAGGTLGAIQRQTNMQVLHALLRLAFDADADGDVRSIALASVKDLSGWLTRQTPKSDVWNAHYRFAQFEIERLLSDPAKIEALSPVVIPPGSPIGSFQSGYHR